MKSELLKECIADAKAIQATALATAKAALEEAFAPKLQEMLSSKLAEEVGIENGDEEVVPQDVSVDEVPTEEAITEEEVNEILTELEQEVGADNQSPAPAPAPAPAPVGGEQPQTPSSDENVPVVTAPVKVVAPGTEAPVAADSTTPAAPTEQPAQEPVPQATEEEINIEELIAELSDEEGEEVEELDETVGDVEKAGTGKNVNKITAKKRGSENQITAKGGKVSKVYENAEEEEVSIDELLAELNDEAGEKEDESDDVCESCKTAQEELSEYKSTVEYLRTQLNEVNLLNAKLLYTNKLFKAKNLNNSQKMKIIESMDLTKTIREVKLTYAAMNEALNLGVVAKKGSVITEGLASKPVSTTKPATDKIVASDVNEMASRFQKLAGIVTKK